jgi:hypothetical protein
VELISKILGFTKILLEFIDKVAHSVHLHALHTFSYEVQHELGDLCGAGISYNISSYELASEAHYAILYRGYLVTSLSFFDFTVTFFDVLCQGEIQGFPWIKMMRVRSLHS